MDERVIVIGAGVGGLVSAALLAARGCDVIVCEAAAGPGGKLRGVMVDGEAIDGGPTVFTMRDEFEEIFAACGDSLGDHLTMRPCNDARAACLGRGAARSVRRPGGERSGDRRVRRRPEARGYRAFRAESKRLFDALDRPFLRNTKTDPISLGWRMGARGLPDYINLRAYTSMWRALARYFRDPRLQQLFGRYATYCGSSPLKCPATLMLIAHVEASGVWLVDGGMHRLALALEALGRRSGTRFRYDAPVREILVERGRATGVILASGERIGARSVICNADPAAIGAGRFGEAARRAVSRVPPQRRSLSAMVWTAQASATGFPLSRHNVFFSDGYPAEFAALAAGRLAAAPSVYVCAQDRDDTGAGPDGRERLQIIVNAPATGDRGRFYSRGDRHMYPSYAGRRFAGGSFARSGAFGGVDDAERVRAPVSLDGWSPLWTGLARVGGLLPPAGQPDADPWALLRGREHAPGRGRPDGGAFRPTSRRMPAQGPRFDVVVQPNGYAWWYIDATSEDGRHGLTIIAFIGSVFSPYYKLSGRGRPENHCAINVALTGPRRSAWAMTERPASRVDRGTDHFMVGPSGLRWDGDTLVIDIAEISAPLPYKVRGTVRVTPEMIGTTAFTLDPAGRHRWHPVAPRAHVEVAMTHPGMAWSGPGYFDSNFGDEPLEDGFDDWHWSRAHLKNDVAVLYEGRRRDGTPFDLALKFDRQGRWHDVVQPPSARLPRTGWLIGRATRADAGHTPRVLKTWIDAPFYARSALATRLFGEDVRAVHESLSLGRFRSPIVQSMLPYRMPRAFW